MSNEFKLSENKHGLSAIKQALLEKRLQAKNISHQIGLTNIPRCPQGQCPLSFSQQQLFFVDQLKPNSAAYNFSIAVRLKGTLDIAVLEKSINEIIRRHESLRTQFIIINSEPIQQILPELRLSVTVEDLTEPHGKNRFATLLSAESRTSFNLAECPLLRIRLFRLSKFTECEQEYVLVMTMPHIITDGWSGAVLYRELGILYEAYVHGRPSPLRDISIQYADFSYWQRQRLQPEVLEKMFSFWKHHLSGSDSDFALPTDRPRPSVQSHNGDEFPFFLSKKLTEALYQLCRKYNATLFALLFSAFNVLLHRYTGEKHIRVGVPIANRGTSEIEALIGYFVNVLVLHTDISGNPKFATLLTRTHEAMLDSQPHQEYPFELLVKELNPVRDPSFNPLFQIMFVFHNVPFDSIRVTGLEIAPFPIESNLSKFDLTLHLTEDPNGLRAYLEYNVDLFDRSTIIRMADHFRVLLENIVATPELRIGELRLLTPSEDRQATSGWITDLGDCSSVIPSCRKDGLIHALFEAQAQREPSAIAVSSNSRTLTYAELNAKANQLAHYLRYKGINPETTVALCIGRLPEMVIGILGVLKAGGTYVPIDPKYPKDEIAYLLEDSGSVLLLTRKPLLSDLPALTIDIACIDEDWEAIAEHSQVNPPTAINPNNSAYIIYTSGSTGKPKGVVVSHQNLLHSTRARFAYYKEPLDGFLLLSPFSFDSSVAGFYWTLSQGAKLCIPDDLTYADPTFLVEWIEKERITHLLCLPSFYNILLDQADAPQLDSLRAVVVAGEVCLSKVAERHYSKLPEATLYNEYGPTEGTVWCSVYKITPEFSDDSIPIGRAIPGVKIYLLDTYLNRVPVGIPGEIYIGGEGVAMGYLNQSALTAERFIPNSFDYPSGTRLYRTGDRARYREDGNMIFLGRDDRQIKIRGFRVELGQIETALLTHPAIEDAAVIDHEIPSGSKHLVAYVISRPGEHRIDADDLRAFLQNKLPKYMVPSGFVFLERFPFRPNGKLDRKALALMDVRDPREGLYVAPRTQMEKTLCAIWMQVLGLEKIGIQDNFFNIGGDSILSMQMVSLAKQAGLAVHPRQLFTHQTIEALAKEVGYDTDVQADQGIITGDVPLIPIQRWFFEQSFPNPHYWNQSVLLEVKQSIDPTILKDVMRRLLEHHDVLRSRFYQHDGLWKQKLADADNPVEIVSVDLSQLAGNRQQLILAEASKWQRRLNLHDGPLVRAIWFDFGRGSNCRLLIIVHHLVIDGVSWRILLEDMNTLYRQALTVREMQLPRKSTSFKLWSERLAAYAQTETPENNVTYWLETDWNRAASLPVDIAGGENSESSGKTFTVSLNSQKTSILVQSAPFTYDARINEVLLAAVVVVLAEWTENDSVFLEMESHGREYLFDDADTSRTVGWFTALFPVLFEFSPVESFPEIVKSVKKQLAAIPNNGIDYGVMRYLSRNIGLVSRLEAIPEPQVGFNYLGRIDQGLADDSLFSLAQESAGSQTDPEGRRPHKLSINASVVAGELHIEWSYSSSCHLPETIERLAGKLVKILEEFATACSAVGLLGNSPNAKSAQQLLSTLDLRAEAALDVSIVPILRQGQLTSTPNNVLLTGITGFVGAFLLEELLTKTQGNIYCLVRSGSDREAAARIEETLNRYAIHKPLEKHRIVPLSGDLAKPLLGLSNARFLELSNEIGIIYHNGSSTNLVLPYNVLKPHNVLGTREILRLACTGTVKPVHYVSTLSVFDDGSAPKPPGFSEDDLPSLETNLTMGYTQSKLVAEHMMRIASERGLPITVYRLGTITWHRVTGVWNPNDFHCLFLKVCIDLGIFPSNKSLFALTPVDFVSRAVVALSNLDSSVGLTYHVCNPQPISVEDLLAWLDRCGYRIEKASPSEWFSAFLAFVSRLPEHPLHTMVEMVASFVEHHHDDSIPYQCGRTVEALKQTGIVLPTIEEGMLGKLLDYLIGTGGLERPSLRTPSHCGLEEK